MAYLIDNFLVYMSINKQYCYYCFIIKKKFHIDMTTIKSTKLTISRRYFIKARKKSNQQFINEINHP